MTRIGDAKILEEVIKDFEERRSYRRPISLGRQSPYHRVLSLRELLEALKD